MSAKDEADLAAEQEEYQRQEALFKATKPLRYQRRGRCYNCDDSCSGLFCDSECRRDYEHRLRMTQSQQAQQRKGKESPNE